MMIDAIRRLLQENGKLHTPVEQLTNADNLYEAGLTPFAAIRVMLALEESFDVEFPPAILRRQSFASIEAIVDSLGKAVPVAKLRRAA
jgi:acyl carrier protein